MAEKALYLAAEDDDIATAKAINWLGLGLGFAPDNTGLHSLKDDLTLQQSP